MLHSLRALVAGFADHHVCGGQLTFSVFFVLRINLVSQKKISPSKPSPAVAQRTQHLFRLDENAQWGGFINIRLSDDNKADFSTWYDENAGQAGLLLDDLLGQGMKVAFSFDAENSCYICTFTGKLLASSGDRFCMTTRAGRLEEVIALACWKHFSLAKGDYDNFRPKTGNFSSWG